MTPTTAGVMQKMMLRMMTLIVDDDDDGDCDSNGDGDGGGSVTVVIIATVHTSAITAVVLLARPV